VSWVASCISRRIAQVYARLVELVYLVARRGPELDNYVSLKRYVSLLVAASVLSACASVGNLVSSPDVSLRNVQLTDFDLSSQTFELAFDVSNPNPFPLPVKSVKYGVLLDGQPFASGSTEGAFSVPASGDGEFSISVSLDLLRSAPSLLSIVRAGARRNIPYEIQGELGVDIPFTKPLSFNKNGEIKLNSSAY
jgi:LEA14-like dessication related protein